MRHRPSDRRNSNSKAGQTVPAHPAERKRGGDPPAQADEYGPVRRLWRSLGPGIVSGAADDDPSGIATYSITGAQFGTSFLWAALVTWPLMTAVQLMCARIGMVTGRGLASALRTKFPRSLLLVITFALFVANTINVGADLAGMADGAELLTGVPTLVWVALFGALIAWTTITLRYAVIASTLKWLALVLFAYVVVAIHLGPNWHAVLHDTVVPSIPQGKDGWQTLVAILGTTISPYLFFWQASQEVEEEKSIGRRRVVDRIGASDDEIRTRRLDVAAGAFFSNLVMFFIILATAMTLHQHGITHPATSRDVAAALNPIAGQFATLLYTVGLIGTGALAIPTLAGSAAYAFAETFGWRQGMDERFHRARAFYRVFALSIAVGACLPFLHVNPVKALFWSAVANGFLAPPLLVGILLVASDGKLMEGQPSSALGRLVVGFTTLLMAVAAVAMLV